MAAAAGETAALPAAETAPTAATDVSRNARRLFPRLPLAMVLLLLRLRGRLLVAPQLRAGAVGLAPRVSPQVDVDLVDRGHGLAGRARREGREGLVRLRLIPVRDARQVEREVVVVAVLDREAQ